MPELYAGRVPFSLLPPTPKVVRFAGRLVGRGPVRLLLKAVKLSRLDEVLELKLAGNVPEKLELLSSIDCRAVSLQITPFETQASPLNQVRVCRLCIHRQCRGIRMGC